MFLGLQEIDHSFLQLLFFPDKYGAGFDKKSSQSRKISGQDGLPHNLAIKTPVLIPYPRTRPVPASRSFGIIPPHLDHIEFSF